MYKALLLLVVSLLVSCSKTYTKELSVREMSQVNLRPGTVITFENDVIILSGRSQEIVDTTECYLDFRECTSEGLCYVSVNCDNDEVTVDLPEIYVNAEYYYQRYSEIPEFSNNFMDGEYHASKKYPKVMIKERYCEVHDEEWVDGAVNCDILVDEDEDHYVEYPTNLMYQPYNSIGKIQYWDASSDPITYRIVGPYRWFLLPDQNYIHLEQEELLKKAMEELEVVAFYPFSFNYLYNEDNCSSRIFFYSYVPTYNNNKVQVTIMQYDDHEVAFVEVDSPDKYDEYSYNAYVRVHDFFKIIEEMMQYSSNSYDYDMGCPIE